MPQAPEVTDLREQLNRLSKERADCTQRGRSRMSFFVLCLAIMAFSSSTVCAGISLRRYFQKGGRKGYGHIKVKVNPDGHPLVVPQEGAGPYSHSSRLHAEVQLLQQLAQSPEKMRLYEGMSQQEKEDWLTEQVSPRRTAGKFLDPKGDRCPGLRPLYQPLVDDMLAPFKGGLTVEQLMSVKSSPSITIVIKHGKMYVRGSMSERRHPMAVLWMEYIYWMLQEVKLPDLVLPINSDDYPVGRQEPWFSFCRQRRSFNDMLLPNMVEDGLFPVLSGSSCSLQKRDDVGRKVRKTIPASPRKMSRSPQRAGKGDTRRPMAVWLGRPMAWRRGKRKAVVEEGYRHPEQVYAGLTDWRGLPLPASGTEDEWIKYYKPRMPLDDWSEHFKYVINVEGACGSARLAKQLYDDAAVFFVSGEDEEWYYPLLKPFVHFIPVTVAPDGSTDLLEQIEWAEAHPDAVAEIARASTAFAWQHLAPRNGRDCYTALLLLEFSNLIANSSQIRPPPGLRPYTSHTPPWPEVSS